MKRSISILFSTLILTLSLAISPSAAGSDAQAGLVSVSYGSLNVRAGSTTGSDILTALTKGSYVTLISKSGSWWRVEYADGKYGYCHTDYITPQYSTASAVRVNGSLNVRGGPGTSYRKLGSLYPGETVLVLSSSGGWSRILYHGTKTGWVSSQYLSRGAGSASVRLSVPYYSQTDSRWANVKLGSSGSTMAKIGCATTGIAMMESYRSGSTITPAAMAKKLQYTASGNVYWPGDYTVVTSSGGYLDKIQTLLQAGKPVLFGAKNRSDSQHWVVVTGFSGGALTASAFTIHDPGTSSRATLDQFLADYPTFYKFFHY